jgi:hypothetical protein
LRQLFFRAPGRALHMEMKVPGFNSRTNKDMMLV